MKTLSAEIEINSSFARVWTALTDFARYRRWNPFIIYAAGEARPGARLKIVIQFFGRKRITFRPVVLEAVPLRKLRWLSRLFIPGLFDGEHSFRLEHHGPEHVHFIQSERFTGLLVPLFPRSFWNSTLRGFEQMNQALKAKAEKP